MPSLYDAPRRCVRSLRTMFRLRGGTPLPRQSMVRSRRDLPSQAPAPAQVCSPADRSIAATVVCGVALQQAARRLSIWLVHGPIVPRCSHRLLCSWIQGYVYWRRVLSKPCVYGCAGVGVDTCLDISRPTALATLHPSHPSPHLLHFTWVLYSAS
mgnify:CR=1 FL=1